MAPPQMVCQFKSEVEMCVCPLLPSDRLASGCDPVAHSHRAFDPRWFVRPPNAHFAVTALSSLMAWPLL